jgi:hypothetical protein
MHAVSPIVSDSEILKDVEMQGLAIPGSRQANRTLLRG